MARQPVPFKESLKEAYNKNFIYCITNSYVKIRWWSPRAYFRTVSNWRVNLIGSRVSKRVNKSSERQKKRHVAENRKRQRREGTFAKAAAAIESSLS